MVLFCPFRKYTYARYMAYFFLFYWFITAFQCSIYDKVTAGRLSTGDSYENKLSLIWMYVWSSLLLLLRTSSGVACWWKLGFWLCSIFSCPLQLAQSIERHVASVGKGRSYLLPEHSLAFQIPVGSGKNWEPLQVSFGAGSGQFQTPSEFLGQVQLQKDRRHCPGRFYYKIIGCYLCK